MTQYLGPQSTPSPIRIAGTSNVDGALQNMSDPGWECFYTIQYPYGNNLVPWRQVTQTVSLAGFPDHFDVEMLQSDANLLITETENEARNYYCVIRVASPDDPYQTVKYDQLVVSLNSALINNLIPVVPSDVPNEYTPAAADVLPSGVHQSTIATQRIASGPIDEHGQPTATHEDEMFGHDEVNRIMEITNQNARILDEHITNEDIHLSEDQASGSNPEAMTFKL